MQQVCWMRLAETVVIGTRMGTHNLANTAICLSEISLFVSNHLQELFLLNFQSAENGLDYFPFCHLETSHAFMGHFLHNVIYNLLKTIRLK